MDWANLLAFVDKHSAAVIAIFLAIDAAIGWHMTRPIKHLSP
jgi:hypothetical protein